jgi:hypothetical protein
MEKQPACKKCGRRLKSPISIAREMGPKCAGVISTSGKSVHARIKRGSGIPYPGAILGQMHAPLFHGDQPAKRLSKREVYRWQREERRRLFETREQFQCGVLLPKRKPLVYTPLEDGNWKENPSGRIVSHERLYEYLKRYYLI